MTAEEARKLSLIQGGESRANHGFLTAAMSANDVMAQVQLVQDVMSRVMKENEHYGVIPGCKKPSLFKPGAEKLCMLFRLDAQYETAEQYDGQHYTVKSKCTLYHIPTGQRIGSGEGLCSSKESKYGTRNGKPNPNLPDVYNTILKMANKRALVAATLVSTAASDIFTQDVEDMPTVLIDAEASVKPAESKQAKPPLTRKLKPDESKLHPPAEEDRVPPEVTDSQAPTAAESKAQPKKEPPVMDGQDLEMVTVKAYSKTKTDKKGNDYWGILLTLDDGSEDWFSTWNSTVFEAAKALKGKQAYAKFVENGDYTNLDELVEVQQ